jgi:hypothetical protein
MPRIVLQFTASGGFVAPAGVTSVQLIGWGGGGGGGAGAHGGLPEYEIPGGAGGGGAQKDVAEVTVEPAETYDVVVGAGGAGAPFTGAYSHGADGGDTTFVRRRDGATLATFRGAGGGTGSSGTQPLDAGPKRAVMRGGGPVAGAEHGYVYPDAENRFPPLPVPGTGGYGFPFPGELNGYRGPAASLQGFPGGNAGRTGQGVWLGPGKTYSGGGGGGGGAAGPGGPGADGGPGGHGKTIADQLVGGDGWNADDNSGAGGGGGGSGGAYNFPTENNVNPSAGGRGGDGGSGRLTLVYVV